MSELKILEKINNQDKIAYLPTYSTHKTVALRIINELLSEHSEYANTLYMLSLLPALIWARNENEKSAVKTCIAKRQNDDFDYTVVNSLTQQIIKELCSGIKKVKGVKGECLKAVHLGYPDVSSYKISTYYREGLTDLCQASYPLLNNLTDKIAACYSPFDAENLIALHDINMLFDAFFALKEDSQRYEETKNMLLELTKVLKNYVCDCDEIRPIITHYIKSKNIFQISKRFGKSRTYIQCRVAEGKDALSICLWGLTSSRSIDWIRNHAMPAEGGL